MSLYRLQGEFGGYLTFEVIGQSKQEVLDRFAGAARVVQEVRRRLG